MIKINKRDDHKGADKNIIYEKVNGNAESDNTCKRQQPGQQFNKGVSGRNRFRTRPAFAEKQKPADNRNVVIEFYKGIVPGKIKIYRKLIITLKVVNKLFS